MPLTAKAGCSPDKDIPGWASLHIWQNQQMHGSNNERWQNAKRNALFKVFAEKFTKNLIESFL